MDKRGQYSREERQRGKTAFFSSTVSSHVHYFSCLSTPHEQVTDVTDKSNKKMEYFFGEGEADWDKCFTREDAEERRQSIVKLTSDGRRHWFPVEVNAVHGKKERRDVPWEYGARSVEGAFYSVFGRIGYDPSDGQWKQVAQDDEGSFFVNTPLAIIDKIKVLSCVLMMENAYKTMALTGAAGVQIRSKKGASDAFLQEVSKLDSKGTIARYKQSDLSNLHHAHYNTSDELCTVNINMPRGFLELAVNLRCISAWYRSKNRRTRIVPHIVPEQENNNSITVDSIISAVRNEHTFKQKAVNSSIFPLLEKAPFRTHKSIVRYSGQPKIYGNNSESKPDITNAASCTCRICRENETEKKHRFTYHKKKGALFFDSNDARHRAECLAPLNQSNELQVHNRCFNCSAVSGSKLLPVICDLGGKLLRDTETALIDLALVRCTAQLELQSNGLLPSHVITFCELLCWKEKTRDMTREEQIKVYKTKLEPVLSQLQLSRQNYAQSGGSFCQALVRGDKLTLLEDQSLVSHKYKNQDTMDIFREKKQNGSGDKPVKLSKHPRRSRGPVYMATHGLAKFGERMTLHGMDLPRDDEM